MHSHTLDDWRHDHVFLGAAHDRNERRTWLVVGLTATMMVAEIAGGTLFGSMALLADGWHMSTHAGTLAIASHVGIKAVRVLPSAPASAATSRASPAPCCWRWLR